MKISECLNEYLNILGDIHKKFYQYSNNELKEIIDLCLKYISSDLLKNNNKIDIIKLFNNRLDKIKKIENEKDEKYKNEHKKIKLKLDKYSLNLNKLLNEKRKIEKELMDIFKDKSIEITKVDNMSKKALSIVDKMNWVVIDPGINSLLTMMSKDKKN